MGAENVVPLALSNEAALKVVSQAAHAGTVIFTRHAQDRMLERCIDRAQVFDCLKKGRVKEPAHRDIGTGNWRLTLERVCCGQLVTVPVAISYKKQGTFAVVITVY